MKASEFGMIIGRNDDFLVCLYLMNNFFLVFCFFAGFPDSVLFMYCLFYRSAQQLCSWRMLAGVRGWGKGNPG